MADLSKMSTEELLAMREQAKGGGAALADVPTEKLLKMRDEAVETERPKTAPGESVLRGAAQGISLGWGDELSAAAGAAKDVVAAKMGLRGDIGFKDAYGTYINKIRAKDDAAHKDNPKLYTGANVAGAVGTSFVPGVGALNSMRGAAGLGAVAGAGASEADPTSSPEGLKQFAADAGKGALLGAVVQKGATLVGRAAKALKPSELTKTANIKTLKAAGFMGKELRQMSEAEKQSLGQMLYDKGVVKLGDGLEEVSEKAAALKEESGQAIGSALDGVDDLVNKAKSLIDEGKLGGNLPPQAKEALKAQVDKQFQFNMKRIGERIRKELIEPNGQNPLLKAERAKLGEIADDFLAGKSLTMREGNVIKGTQGKVTNFNSDTVPQAFKKEVYDIIKTEIDDIVAKTGNLEGAVAKGEGNAIGSVDVGARNKSIADAFQDAKKTYGGAKQVAEVSQNRLGQTQANREVSLTDTIAAVGGLASGGPANAIVLGGLNKLARQYGDTAIASGARTAAKIIGAAPEMLGKYAALLEQAAAKGAPQLSATHLALMRDPNYQRILAEYEKSDNAMGRRLRSAPAE